MKTNKKPNDFTILLNDGEVAYMKDEKGNYYCLDYFYADKSIFRDYACVQPTQMYVDEDGDLCKEYDDETWEIDNDIIKAYIEDYDKDMVYENFNETDSFCGHVFLVDKDTEWWDGLPVSERLEELDDIEIDGVCHNDYPKYTDAYISSATIFDGFNNRQLTEEEIELINEDYDFVHQKVLEYLF